MKTTVIKTIDQAKELLISLYKREIDNTKHYATQTKFDTYVEAFCTFCNIAEENITDEQLLECAHDFIQNDGGDYLLNND